MTPKQRAGFGFYLFRRELEGTDPSQPPEAAPATSREALAGWFLDFGFACRAARLGVR